MTSAKLSLLPQIVAVNQHLTQILTDRADIASSASSQLASVLSCWCYEGLKISHIHLEIDVCFKVSLCCVLLVTVLVERSWAQKGGAKGAMRNKGKGGGGGRREGGGGHEEADDYGIMKFNEFTN